MRGEFLGGDGGGGDGDFGGVATLVDGSGDGLLGGEDGGLIARLMVVVVVEDGSKDFD